MAAVMLLKKNFELNLCSNYRRLTEKYKSNEELVKNIKYNSN